ncbi:HD domain-containing protein [Desulfoluna spongiiphila]|uniref:HD domain-containing protein n=1 Tax=Desulfoluna spongiiphila TaxID=419481 RepID=A0A1G5H2M8_9BACT|nr:HD domain-containing protein [Desulfoluna spongiiphila]SCY58105.1 hypothetical protein SAMN05216233_11288 [Desulfoluna spongiiphila]VVS94753.1 hypothetical protein DBB_43250 [Desulfoluna spongiiphila]
MTVIYDSIPLVDELFDRWQGPLASEYQGYRNHVYRMLHFCFALGACTETDREKLCVAGVFHDMGLWIEDTFDYIPASIPPAMQYLRRRNLDAWSDEVALMISEHHKLRPYRDMAYPLVEVFRKGDLVDVSLGLCRFGIDKAFIRDVRAHFPNAGFHLNLSKRAARWFVRHPLDPVPMMKW